MTHLAVEHVKQSLNINIVLLMKISSIKMPGKIICVEDFLYENIDNKEVAYYSRYHLIPNI